MADAEKTYPYVTHLNVLYPQMEVVDVPRWLRLAPTAGTTKLFARSMNPSCDWA